MFSTKKKIDVAPLEHIALGANLPVNNKKGN